MSPGSCVRVNPADLFLTAAERGNLATRIDSRHVAGRAWTCGNDVRLLVHGAPYFAELADCLNRLEAGDLLLFTDWRGDPDELLSGAGPRVSAAICAAAHRGARVAGLVWRSHLDRLAFSAAENRHLGEQIEAAGGQCLLDMRVRPGGSHHMKMIVLRYRSQPEQDVAFVGGIDLCHSRRDDRTHRGDQQAQPMAAVYGRRPPWHDAQLMIRGPAVGDVETVFRERWEDPAPLSRNPAHRLRDLLGREQERAAPLPPQLPDPQPCGRLAVQVLRTYPYRSRGYPFAPDGERSIARAYRKVLPAARSLVYLEDQYLWSAEVVGALASGLRSNRALRLIAVIPRYPDQGGRLSGPPNLVGRAEALAMLRSAGGDRVAVYGLENADGTPVYVHAKVCVVDDAWAMVGSDNFNRRSWTHDSELSCAVMDEESSASRASAAGGGAPAAGVSPGGTEPGAAGQRPGFARRTREELCAEHLGLPPEADVPGGTEMFRAFESAARLLDDWHLAGRAGQRPPGQLRAYPDPALSAWTKAWTTLPYRLIYDPDGRPAALRRAGRF